MDFDFLLGARLPEVPNPVRDAIEGYSLRDLARRDREGVLREQGMVDQRRAAEAYNKAIPAVIQSGFDEKVVAQVLQQYPEAAPLIQKAWDDYSRRRDEGKKTDATVYKDKTASLLKQYSQMSAGLADAIKRDPASVPDAMIAKFYAGMADNGLAQYMPALPFQSWADKQAVVAHLEQLGNAFYETSDRIRNTETGRHNLRTEGLTERGQDLTRKSAQEGHQVTMRGQNMTDARSRESTAVAREANAVAREAAGSQKINAETQAYAKMIESTALPNLITSASALDATIKKYGNTRDMPGVGIADANMPAFLRSAEGNKVRSQVQAVANDLLKLYSGGAVTANEAERRATEMMASGQFSETDLRNAWPLVLGRINAAAQNVRAGFSPEAVSAYESRGGVKLQPIGSGAPAEKQDSAKVPAKPKVGEVRDGYRFMGGDPAVPSNWRKEG